MLKTVELIGCRQGIGGLLAEGVKRAAEQLGRGAADFAMHVKGQELPLHEPRGKTGKALAYALSPTGADHIEAPDDPYFELEQGAAMLRPLGLLEPLTNLELGPRKVRMFAYMQQMYNLFNSLGLCNYTAHPGGPISYNTVPAYVQAVTGWETNLWELLKVGERHSAMSRIFNLREGFSAEDDRLPERLFQPLQGGPLAGKALNRQEFDSAVKLYYGMMGWNELGVPRGGKLEELDLGWLREKG
jgi:aldehyde:ferredoxin oxidoreductase